MGGYGSGRTSAGGKKGVVERHYAMDVRQWYRTGRLIEGRRFNLSLSAGAGRTQDLHVRIEASCIVVESRFSTHDRGPQERSQTIWLDWTPCHLGGERPWLLCPAAGCGRRVAILYWGGYFACRHCLNLCYQTQLDEATTRASKRVDRTREKLGWKPGFLNGWGWKPKYMHWTTFGVLIRRYEQEVIDVKLRLVAKFKLADALTELLGRK